MNVIHPNLEQEDRPRVCAFEVWLCAGGYAAGGPGHELALPGGKMNVTVTPVTNAEYGLSKAVHPFNSRLDKKKLVKNGFAPLLDWRDAVGRYLRQIME